MRLATACLTLLLAGCAALPPLALPVTWPERQAELQELGNWSLSGRVAVATADDGYSGGFSWQQAGEVGLIGLRGPMGGSSLRLRLDGKDLSIRDGEGGEVSGDAAQRYLLDQLGTSLPVDELRYWIRGIPAPGSEFRLEAGEAGQLAGLGQSGWQVRYDSYEAVGGVTLPRRMQIQAGDVRVRLLIRSWDIGR